MVLLLFCIYGSDWALDCLHTAQPNKIIGSSMLMVRVQYVCMFGVDGKTNLKTNTCRTPCSSSCCDPAEVCGSDVLNTTSAPFTVVLMCFLLMTSWCLPTFRSMVFYLWGRGRWCDEEERFQTVGCALTLWLSDSLPHSGLQVLFVHAPVVNEACWRYQWCSYVNRYCDVWMFVLWNIKRVHGSFSFS